MTGSKSLLTSRTLWSNVIGLGAVVFSLLGVDTGMVDQGLLADAIPQAIAAISFVASSVFRITATKRLNPI